MFSKNAKRVMGGLLALSLVIGTVSAGSSIMAAKKTTLKTKKKVSMYVGSSKKIALKNKNKKCTYVFKSNKPKFVRVGKSTGKITALKKGTAKITVIETRKGTKKKRTVGVIKVTVKPVIVKGTAAPVNNNSTTAAPTAVRTSQPTATVKPSEPAATNTPDKAVATPGATMEPAYGSYDFDSFTLNGNSSLNMDKLMKYGGQLTVSFKAEQNSGSTKDVKINYSGNKFSKNYNQDGPDFVGASETISVESGATKDYSATIDFDKFMLDCKVNFESEAGTDIKISDVKITTVPFENGDYAKMVEDSYISGGNNSRLKKVINKSLSGEDVTFAYLGGSITEGCAATDNSVNSDCYAETSYNEFKTKYGYGDGSNVHFINAGMSGTPSSLGVIRYKNDVLDQMQHGKFPDVLFIEFVVNDSGECTNGEGIESLIRQGLEAGTAVFLVFAHTVNFDTGKQDYYIPLGEKYDLPMVSVKNALTPVIDSKDAKGCPASKWFYHVDTLHPDVPGHRLMADMIMQVFDKAYEEQEVPDTITDIDSITPVYGKSFTGMTQIDADVDISKVDAIESLEVGSFSEKDTNQNKFQYEKGGESGVEWFPNCWMHKSGTDSFKATVKCSNMMIAYKLSNNAEFGKAELYVDGELKETMDGYKNDGWNNATVSIVFKDDEIATHTFEIKMASGNENKKFTIYAIGYTNADDYKASLK